MGTRLLAVAGGLAAAGSLASAHRAVGAGQTAQFGIASFSVATTVAHEPTEVGSGERSAPSVNEPYPYTQAAGHPYALTTAIELAHGEGQGVIAPTQEAKNIAIDLPSGLIADPQAAPRCGRQLALAGEACPVGSQVGEFTADINGVLIAGAVVELAPRAGQSAELGFVAFGKVELLMTGQFASTPRGYGLAVAVDGVPRIGLVSLEVTLWGVPADPSHDPQRGLSCERLIGREWECSGGGQRSGLPLLPFLTMPDECAAAPPSATAQADPWVEPGRWVRATSTMPAPSGCRDLSFAPELEASPESLLADEATGMTVRVESPRSEPGQTGASESTQASGSGSSQAGQSGSSQAGGSESAEGAPATGESATAGESSPSTPPLREASVTLPQGVSLNPAFAAGARVCPASGPEGIDIPTGTNAAGQAAAGQALTPEEAGEGEEIGPDGLKRLAPGHCPEAAKVGRVEAKTLVLGQPLTGGVYLAQPLCGDAGQAGCTEADAAEGRLFRLYVELTSSDERGPEGIVQPGSESTASLIVKLAGYVDVNPATGQVTVHIDQAPQLPLEDLTISLDGGERALLANPAGCGQATTTAKLVPWSASGTTPEGVFVAGTPDVSPSSFYVVNGCSSSTVLSPGFVAGSSKPLAGASSAFTVSVTRGDREPYLRRLQVRLPPGVSARLADVAQCASAVVSVGACPAFSVIGAAVIEAGAGSAPLQLHGTVYLTGPYDGNGACSAGQVGCAPFGLAIVVDGQVGPFDLGTILVRARVDIDPRTAAITITSDPLPQIVLGVPLRLRRMSLEIDRPGFVLNPTGCGAERVSGAVEGVAAGGAAGAGGGAVAASVSSPFAAAECARLAFAPRVSASAQGNGRLAGHGASLRLTVSGGQAGGGVASGGGQAGGAASGEANLRSIRLALPRRLAARLPSIQRACVAQTFAANPAACPAGAVIGDASVSTPILPAGRGGVSLSGPVYLVSVPPPAPRPGHRARGALPDIVLVLQGDGVRIDLTGALNVSANNVTTTTFGSVPDVPISRLALDLPEGPHSILAAGGSLCKRRGRLRALATLRGQNGALVRRAVPVGVLGCRARTKRRRRRGP